ncbi:MAG: hypothetical protein IJC52_03915, partial [Clostridia bacterium]|nr:hypothetical protein [Clostridia bacterium]
EDIREMVALGGEHTMVATGLGVYMDTLGAYEMERQAREDNECGTCGDFYFEANTYLSDKTYDALSQTVYRREAIPPFADVQTSVTTWLLYMQERVDNVLLPLGGVDDAQAAALRDAIGEVKAYTQNGVMDETALAALREVIAAVKNEKARAVLENDLAQAMHIQTVITAKRDVSAAAQGADGVIWWIVGAAVVVVAAAAVIVAAVCRKRKTTNGKEETA